MSQDFSKSKIYKITNDFDDSVYVGSTCDTLVKRFSRHKTSMNEEKKKHLLIYKLMNDFGFERFRIDLIEDYSCNDKQMLRHREGFWIRELKANLNMKIEGRNKQMWYEDNKERMLNKFKEYQNEHKHKIQEYQKNYQVENQGKLIEYRKEYGKISIICECGCELAKKNLSIHKKSKKHFELLASSPLTDIQSNIPVLPE